MDKLTTLKARDKEVFDLPSHTVEENRYMWNNYDWSNLGEEWGQKTADPERWRASLLNDMMFKYIKPESVILEIGPGAGRWSQYLQKMATRLILVDIAPNCIEMCRKRFADKNNVEYYLIKDNIDFLEPNSIDFVWSYDVFVHVNPSDIQEYVRNISRVLKKAGIGIIHHSTADYDSRESELQGFRSKMSAEKFAEFVTSNGMRMIEQNSQLVHKKGDIISVFTK